ncbi:hypothetical protein [Maioricimonas sp. JC845]|uniref:EF-hand domain-containing protein n=1 Tax=Maioricimonas sp. JC845 TaxID=3232138 RepID=UPI00345A1CAC
MAVRQQNLTDPPPSFSCVRSCSMKRSAILCLGLAVVVGTAASAMAQRPEGGRPPGGGPGGGRGFGPPPNPIMEAMDTDKDGELSAEEIANAAVALKSLDKDKDGKLSREELRPPRGEGGRGFGGRGGAGGGSQAFVDRMMAMDANKDGKLSKDEIPERMQRIMERADTNKDDVLDKAEIEAMASQFGGRGGRGGQGGRGGRGGRGGDGGEGGGRPQRPSPDA